MTEYGVTSTGFNRKPFAEIRNSMQARTRALIGAPLALDDKDPFGAILHSGAEEMDLVWQALEAAYYSNDPLNAEDFLLFALGGLTGTTQLASQKGEVLCTLGLDALKTFAPGDLVAHVLDDPANRWVNRDTVTSTTAGSYPNITFLSENAGSQYVAPAGMLTVLAERKSGWTSITNPADALSGSDAESADDFRIRREESLTVQGSASAEGIRADVARVDGVIQVRVYENDTDETVDGLPARSVRVVVWDNSPAQASDNEIAQAILDSKAAGIKSYGTTDSGIATDSNGDAVTIDFDRATIVPLYCACTIVAPSGADEADVNALIQAKVADRIGVKTVFISAKASPLSATGVTDVPVFKLDTIDPPVNASANLQPDPDAIFILDSGDIDLTVLGE